MNLSQLLCIFVLVLSATSPGMSAQESAAAPAVAQPSQTTDEGWLVFRGDAGSTGVAKSDLPADLEVLWEYKVPNGAFDGTAVIARSKKDRQEMVFIGDMDGVMHAIDLKTGKKKWDLNATIGFSSSAAYRDGLIYIGDLDGFLYCIDETGKLKWKFETEGEISSSANFFDGQVLIGSQDSRIYLVDAATGKKIWQHQTPDQIQCSLTLAGDRAFVAGCDGFLHVIDLKNGKEVGAVDIHSPTQSTPAVLGEKVFFGTEQAEFLAVNWKNVKGEWAFADDKGQASVRGCAAVTKGHVIFGARNRQVYSLDPDTGKINWKRTLKARVDSSPVIVGDRVFVGSTDGRLYGLSLKNGETLWEKQFNGGFLSSPAVAFDRLVIATDRGVVYCLGKKKAE
jgi:outer membrane protein assembly factor BamB